MTTLESKSKDKLGDLLKGQEQVEAGRKADPFLPLMARIDGKCFSKFTKGLQRPFDERFVALMVATTEHLVEQSEALLGYCQSDEITLYWYNDKDQYSNRDYWFGGKYQKLTSVLASTASSYFTANLPNFIPEKVGQYPAFDCRVWNVPDLEHVWKNFLWRFRDAEKNSVSMYARHFFPHSNLQNKKSGEMKQMLYCYGKPWDDLPSHFREGTYVRRERILVPPDDATMEQIPEQYRPKEPIMRTQVRVISKDVAWDLLLNQFNQKK
jgi:tRNA(His) 5'-end guanylyltransferase